MKVSGPLSLAGLEDVADRTALDPNECFEGRIIKQGGTVYVYTSGVWEPLAAGADSVPTITLGDAGKVLKTPDGISASWEDQYPAGTAGTFLRTDGSGNVTWENPPGTLPTHSAGTIDKVLISNGTTPEWGEVVRESIEAGTANHVIINDINGDLDSAATLPVALGGTGADATLWSGIVKASGASFSAAALTEAELPSGIDATKIADGSVTDTEFQYLAGLDSNVQDQLDAKLPLTGGTLTGVLTLDDDPVQPLEAATKQYVDNVASGLNIKNSVFVAADSNLTLSGEQTVDGQPLVTGDRVLCMGQTTQADRGIYRVSTGAWTRTSDADTWAELVSAFTFVEAGSYGDCGFVCTVNQGGTLGVTPVTWVQFSGAGTYTNGSGLELSGSTFSVKYDSGATIVSSGSAVGQGLKVSDTVALVTPSVTNHMNFSAIATPSAPGAGVLVYAKADGKLYKRPAGEAESIVGGGLVTDLKSTTFTAAAGYHYLCDTGTAAFTATLPAGATGSVIRFSDDTRSWANTNLTLTPATGESIANLATNESLICDVSGAFVQLAWDGSRWVVDTNGYVAAITSGTLSSAQGMGAKNYCGSPDNITSFSAHDGNILLAAETTATNFPANSTKTSCIRITNNGGSSYVRLRFTLDKADYGKKFQISFDQAYAGTAGDYTLAAYSDTLSTYAGTSTSLPLQTSSISGLTGSFLTTFDAPNASAPYVEIRINGVSGTTPLYLNNFYVGPGVTVQGAAISEWVSWTPTGFLTTNTSYAGQYRRVGSGLDIEATISFSGAPVGAAATIDLPNGYTIGTLSDSNTGTRRFFGMAFIDAGTNKGWARVSAAQGDTRLYVEYHYMNANTDVVDNRIADVTGSSPFTLGASHKIVVRANDIPVSQFSGSGTVNLGAGAHVEYLSTGFSSFLADRSPRGTELPTSTPAGTFEAIIMGQSPWQYAQQQDDEVRVEIQVGGVGPWLPCDAVNVDPIRFDGANYIGLGAYYNVGTGLQVIRGKYRNGTGSGWNTVTVGTRYRLVKAKPSSPVGFGLAGSDGSAGLVNPYTAGSGVVYAGTYTPTLTNGSNVSGNTPLGFQYQRIGKFVTVYGIFNCTTSAAGNTLSVIEVSLPIASNLTGVADLCGSGSRSPNPGGSGGSPIICYGSSANDRAILEFNSTVTTNSTCCFSFSYELK